MLNSQSTRSQRQTCAAQKNFRQIAWKLYLVGMMLYFVNCVRITELEKIEMLNTLEYWRGGSIYSQNVAYHTRPPHETLTYDIRPLPSCTIISALDIPYENPIIVGSRHHLM